MAFLDRTLSTFFTPAETSALARVVPLNQLPEAVGRNDAREHLASILGPPLGGALFGLAIYAPFAAYAASYGISFASTAALVTPLEPPPRTAMRLRAELADGLRFVWRVPFLRASIFQAAGTNLTWSGLLLTLVFIARAHGASSAEVGAMYALIGLGGLLGSASQPQTARQVGAPRNRSRLSVDLDAPDRALTLTSDPFVLGAIAERNAALGYLERGRRRYNHEAHARRNTWTRDSSGRLHLIRPSTTRVSRRWLPLRVRRRAHDSLGNRSLDARHRDPLKPNSGTPQTTCAHMTPWKHRTAGVAIATAAPISATAEALAGAGVYASVIWGLRPPPPRRESLGAMRLPATGCVLGRQLISPRNDGVVASNPRLGSGAA